MSINYFKIAKKPQVGEALQIFEITAVTRLEDISALHAGTFILFKRRYLSRSDQ